jgi:hypothetical protein
LASVVALGCAPGDVAVRGTVFSSFEATSPLPDAEVLLRDVSGKIYDRAAADAAGDFSVAAPSASDIVVEVRAEGYASVAFAGGTGEQDVFKVPDGLLYAFAESDLEDWEALFAGCPGIGEGGAILGDIRFRELFEPGSDVHATTTDGFISVDMDDGTQLKACYLDDEGLVLDEGSETTGETGRFAIFGVPPGFGTMTVGYMYTPQSTIEERTVVYMPEGGVSPWFPAWVSLPM